MANNKIALAYHSIGECMSREAGAELYCVSAENFKAQMECLHNNNITFDDGDMTNYTKAYPILKEFGVKAHFFIIGEWVGRPGYMDWAQIRELHNSGMVIGSHGMTHRILTELNDEELNYELRESRSILEDEMSQAIDYLSIPRGFYNKKIIDKAEEIGYKAVFTSDIKDKDGFKFGRISIKRDWSLAKFIRILNNGYSVKDKAGELIKSSSKKLLGPGYYDSIRTRILG
ncbi:MAG: polysaccharide deacetylase family protein [Candidatus Omnitrophota bacterium]